MLTTKNASAVIPGITPDAQPSQQVEVLIATFIKSVGRDVQVGEVVEISPEDFRFLVPYGYAKKVEPVKVAEPVEPVEPVEPAEDESKAVDTEDVDESKDVETASNLKPHIPQGKRK